MISGCGTLLGFQAVRNAEQLTLFARYAAASSGEGLPTRKTNGVGVPVTLKSAATYAAIRLLSLLSSSSVISNSGCGGPAGIILVAVAATRASSWDAASESSALQGLHNAVAVFSIMGHSTTVRSTKSPMAWLAKWHTSRLPLIRTRRRNAKPSSEIASSSTASRTLGRCSRSRIFYNGHRPEAGNSVGSLFASKIFWSHYGPKQV